MQLLKQLKIKPSGGILEEIQALQERGYRVTQNISESILMVSITAPGEWSTDKCVSIGLPFDSSKSKTVTAGFMSRVELDEFMSNFPKDKAPTLAKILENNPPKPNDLINNNFQEKAFRFKP